MIRTEPAPAKINLALHVTGRRADGYHLLDSLVVFARVGAVMALIGATWTLMAQPQVTERRRRDQSRRDVQRAARTGESTSPVTIVDLRPLRTQPVTDRDETGRRLHTRFLVRGHWRQQYHPSDHSHRPRWINSYLKGPKGAPLKTTDTIRVWRR